MGRGLNAWDPGVGKDNKIVLGIEVKGFGGAHVMNAILWQRLRWLLGTQRRCVLRLVEQ